MKTYKCFLNDDLKTINGFSISTYIDRLNLYLKLWISFFKKFDLDIYVFVDKINFNEIQHFLKDIDISNINFINVSYNRLNYSGIYGSTTEFLNNVKSKILDHYEKHIYLDVDEIIVCENLNDVLKNSKLDYITTNGFEIVHNFYVENTYDENLSFLSQRNYGLYLAVTETRSPYDKVCIFSKSLKNQKSIKNGGRHAINEKSENLIYLIHLGRFDINLMLENSKHGKKLYSNICQWHNFNTIDDVKKYMNKYFIPNIIQIPDFIKNKIFI